MPSIPIRIDSLKSGRWANCHGLRRRKNCALFVAGRVTDLFVPSSVTPAALVIRFAGGTRSESRGSRYLDSRGRDLQKRSIRSRPFSMLDMLVCIAETDAFIRAESNARHCSHFLPLSRSSDVNAMATEPLTRQALEIRV